MNEPVAHQHTDEYGRPIGFLQWRDNQKWPASQRVPLYWQPQPLLTDEEREAVERAADWLDRWQKTHGYHSAESGDLATLRGLLGRHRALHNTCGD